MEPLETENGRSIGIEQLEIRNADDLIKDLRGRKPGETINLKVFRDGKFADTKVTPQERPRPFLRKNKGLR